MDNNVPDRLALSEAEEWEVASVLMREAAAVFGESLRASCGDIGRVCTAIVAEETELEITELERIAHL